MKNYSCLSLVKRGQKREREREKVTKSYYKVRN
ncbi:unnamed protein product [Spirodela intermedia]|uniref:Uncharacterized protein n=2 Tax=Spirodela intermedia TaxID=51605 RepID=A0A7I8J5P2_SPIIN|nr:unnamed protein product [Spirodela intermedia]CAA6665085.1 unnamed protein product [Spirodela intermedia]CAA7401743.1 unnamed protein product [Spirodela intermedia]